jgi:hypothetical protein
MLRGTVPPVIRGLALAFSLMLPVAVRADNVVEERFESAERSWRVLSADVRYRMEAHERTTIQSHSGQRSERLRLVGDNGSYIYLGHAVTEARIIDELQGNVWLRADRPGLQLLARVVLPRTIDPSTNRPATLLIPGDSYSKVGIWQRLSLRDFPLLVERQARVLRTSLGPAVDTREAYVDQLVLNVYGGPGVTHLWIDDLEVTGVVPRVDVENVSNIDRNVRLAAGAEPSPQRLPAPWEASDAADKGVPDVRLQGNLLVVGGKPFFPRIVQYRGEPLDLLKRLGFNAVRVSGLPSFEILQEAKRHEMWIIAQPPSATDLSNHSSNGRTASIGHDFNRVLAWDLGSGLAGTELDVVRPWIKSLRTADPRRRPILCQPATELRAYSRYADVLMAERRPLGTSHELNEYGMWLRSRMQLARPGTPVWTTIQTQPTPELIEQLSMLSGGQPPRLSWQYEQVRLLAVTALAAGMRGICFESLTPLDATDVETRDRAAILEWINLELELLQPWTSAGTFVTAADCTNPQLVGVLFQTDRARLLLPLAIAPQNQFAIDHGQTGAVTFTVPAIPESNVPYEISPAGLRRLAHRRVSGGLQITLSEGDRVSPIVITQDPLVMAQLTRQALQLGKRMFELQRAITAGNLSLVAEVDRRLTTLGRSLPQNAKLLETARLRLKESETIAAANDPSLSEERARQGILALRQIERAQWKQGVDAFGSPVASPFSVSFQTLPQHWQFVAEVASAQRSPNRLRGGDCESLDEMLSAGWKRAEHAQAGIATTVEQSAANPHGGSFALQLKSSLLDKTVKGMIVESPPLWVTSAPLLVEPGALLQISGFVRLGGAIEGSVDGLLIFDSVTGETLAERIRTAPDWRPFTLFRIVPQSGNLTITFAMTGIGEAWIDDVTIQSVDRRTANPQATRLPMAGNSIPPFRR